MITSVIQIFVKNKMAGIADTNLQDTRRKETIGWKSRKNWGLASIQNLKVKDLREELQARGEDDSGLKPELQERLNAILGGTSRVPALLYGDNNITLSSLNLTDYEVLFFEPLHCCLDHIAHILEELPHHIKDVHSLLAVKETISITLNKVKIRGTDYRRALLHITIQLMKQAQVPESVLELLLTFSEMMGIYYANEDRRNPRQVLRLYNLAFRHALALESVMLPPKTMTVRRLQGIHYHQGIDHAPLIYRMICFRSISAELFEIFFDRLQDITQKTWSKQPQDLVPNAFLHIIAEDEFEQERDTMAAQENEISKLAKSLPAPSNTMIDRKILIKRSSLWQSHLKNIADYLSPGCWWQWTDDGSVEFRDGPQEEPSKPAGPSLCHFRSTTIKYLHEDLEVEWEEISCNAVLPWDGGLEAIYSIHVRVVSEYIDPRLRLGSISTDTTRQLMQ
ncbi:hypothetical protein QZH41_018544 [Actinostola sp. cb2023]|nr:hypothetical protein QZH41_018544 [Actinostola sp. cb2023]